METDVKVRSGERRGMLAVKGDFSNGGLKDAVRAICGTAFPDVGRAETSGDRAVFWMAPDEVMVVTGDSERAGVVEDLRRATEGQHVLIEDVSDMRGVFVLEGAAMRDVLARVTPADASPTALPPGSLRRTRIGQVAGAVWIRGEGLAELVCFRSVAHYVREMLDEAAASEPLGLHHVGG